MGQACDKSPIHKKKHAARPAIQLREKESHGPQSPNNGSISSSVRFVIHGGVTSNTTK
jgi:hypothetical protein